MKKRNIALLFGAIAASTLVVASVSLLAPKASFEMHADNDPYTISALAEDFTTNTEYGSGTATLKTDQLRNDVAFGFTDTKYRLFNETGYLDVKAGGTLYNIGAIRSIAKMDITMMGTFRIEWGWKEGDNVVYYRSEEAYVGNFQKTFVFEYSQPSYLRITNVDTIERQISQLKIYYARECVETPNPYAVSNGLSFMKHDTYAEVIGFSGEDLASVNIPAEIDGLPVTSIMGEAFKQKTSITSLSLPHGLETIGIQAFDGCSNIASITIPNTVTVLHTSCFRDNSSATVTFEAGGTSLLSLGSGAIENTGHVGIMTLPSRIGSFSTYDFVANSGVTGFALNDDNVEGNIASVIDGVLFGDYYGTYTLVAYPIAAPATSYTVPSNVEAIMDYSGFSLASNLEEITFTNTVDMVISSYCMEHMYNLETLNFNGTGKVSFYWYPLRDCPKLKSLIIPDTVEVRERGLAGINEDSGSPLALHFLGAKIPDSWHSNWDGGDVEKGYITTDFNYVA